jgi:hypothetical protein
LVCRERIAIGQIAAIISAFEPTLPLIAGAVGKAFGADRLPGVVLQHIVTNPRDGVDRLVNVAGL